MLVAASGWVVPEVTDTGAATVGQHRTAVLTLIDVTALDAAQARAEHLAWHDVLTGLPNRAAFDRALDALAAEDRGGAALLLVDLDRFKAVNDQYGHCGGRRAAARGGDANAETRFDLAIWRAGSGGDEFAVLLRGADAVGHVAETAARLSRALRRPLVFEGVELPLSASIGFARYPADAATADGLKRAADLALYRVKHEGRGGVAEYAPALGEAVERRPAATGGARPGDRAERVPARVAEGRCSPLGGALRGAEALLRWPGSPLGGAVSPAEFLPVAAEAGLMPAIDAWVLEAALCQVSEWGERQETPPVVAINISASTLGDQSFPARVAEALMRHRLPAAVLEIEIPEDIAARDLDRLSEVLHGLRAIGVKLALDDFGGGLSSVAHLVRLGEERLHLRPPHIAAKDGLLVVVDAMQGEHGLGRVEADALKIHADGPSGLDVDSQTLARDAAGPSTPTRVSETAAVRPSRLIVTGGGHIPDARVRASGSVH